MTEVNSTRTILRLLEALLFVADKPLSLSKLQRVVAQQAKELAPKTADLLAILQQEYQDQQRAFTLDQVGGGYLLRTCEEFAPHIEACFPEKKVKKLSKAATEILAIIALRQPITRPQIEALRGVDSSGPLRDLIERELVEEKDRLEVPGRPVLYGTTDRFLAHFGLRDVSELKQLHSNKS